MTDSLYRGYFGFQILLRCIFKVFCHMIHQVESQLLYTLFMIDLHQTLTFLQGMKLLMAFLFDKDVTVSLFGCSEYSPDGLFHPEWKAEICAQERLSFEKKCYQSDLAVFGRTHNDTSSLIFDSLSVDLSSLFGWSSSQIIKQCKYGFTDQGEIGQITLDCKEEVLFDTRIETLNAQIVCSRKMNYGNELQEAAFEQMVNIRIVPDTGMHLCWYRQQVEKIRKFYALLMGLPVELLWMGEHYSSEENEPPDYGSSILYQNNLPSLDEEHDAQILMPYALLGLDVEKALQLWFSKQEKLEMLTELSLGVIYNAHSFPKFEFLALVQALESYHRMSNPKFNKKMSLESRIELIQKEIPDRIKTYVTIFDGSLNKLARSRHYYTHYNPSQRSDAFDDSQLRDVNKKLHRLIIVTLYMELGIPENKIIEAFKPTNFRERNWWPRDSYFHLDSLKESKF